jgi:predicted AlkP superfamily phosphohydrolase/phosphomutase
MDPLLAAGRLPRFKSLIERGARGILRSENPTASPALWTTIVTGRPRAQHGISGFLVREHGRKRGRLVASGDRKTLALWNIASALGRRVGFVGWWASWPAEAVDGWIVSDRATRERWS